MTTTTAKYDDVAVVGNGNKIQGGGARRVLGELPLEYY
jgi:hypothetical protein